MSTSIVIELEMPGQLKRFTMPSPLHDRLQELLDRQDELGKLSLKERKEATALVQLSEMLSLLKLKAKLVSKRRKR